MLIGLMIVGLLMTNVFSYPYLSGNRVVQGRGTFPAVNLQTLAFEGEMNGWSFPLNYGEMETYITSTGDLMRGEQTLPLNALPDARLVVSSAGHLALYTDATNQRYVHGVLGDDLEAASLTILGLEDGRLQILNQIQLTGESVFEGQNPIWADVDLDGNDELITTVSDSQGGAQLRIYRADASVLAQSDPIGQGGRWRHQIAWGAFGEDGEVGLVEVMTPHIGGILGFYQIVGAQLVKTAEIRGYTSHVIGSRNLDMALAGDFDGDGRLEIVLPTQDLTRLVGLQIEGETWAERWSFDLGGKLSSNSLAFVDENTRLGVAVGTDAGELRIWRSQ